VTIRRESLPWVLLVTAIDLTRACAAHELYLTWLSHYADALHGSAGIANYLVTAAIAFEEQAHPQLPISFDPFIARENLSDLLMGSAPLSREELRDTITTAIHDACDDQAPLLSDSRPLRIELRTLL